ncbi:MAG: response regulator [Actinomycetota bacterium]
MTTVLLATDSDRLFEEVDAALATDDTTVLRVRAGADVIPVCQHDAPDAVLLDLQIGNMGGVATCLAVKQEQQAGRLPEFGVGLLLDRSVDVFLAGEARADGWLVKPANPIEVRGLLQTLRNHDKVDADTDAG